MNNLCQIIPEIEIFRQSLRNALNNKYFSSDLSTPTETQNFSLKKKITKRRNKLFG